MDKVSVTKTQASSNKILKTQESNKKSMFQAKLCFSGKVLFGQAKGTNDVTKFQTPVVSETNKRQFCNGCKGNV